MPIINTFDDGDPGPATVNLGGSSSLSLSGSVGSGLRVHLAGTSGLTLRGGMVFAAGVTLPGTSSLFAHARINGEANKFGSIHLPGTSGLTLRPIKKIRAKTVLAGTSSLTLRPTVKIADRAVLSLLITVVPANNAVFGDTISARVIADGVTYPVRAATYSEPRDAAGVSLNFTLQKPSDRAAILAAASFRFDIYTAGTWTTKFDSGRRSAGGFSFAWIDARPDDSLNVSTVGPISDRMTRSPLYDLTVYDGLRQSLTSADFPTIYDTDGNAYNRQLVNIGGLTLYDLLQYVFVTTLGFADYQTDIPNYSIRRADFEMTGTYLSGIAPFIGMCSPLIFVKGSTVWILDGTQTIPAGFATPYPLHASDYKTAQLQETVNDADGYLVTYSDAAEFDYSLDREIIDPTDVTASPHMEISRKRTIRDYFKTSNPAVPVRSEKISEVEETRANVEGSFLTIHKAVETINLDSNGKLINISAEVTGLVPTLVDPFTPTTRTIRSERTDFTYAPVLSESSREILAETKRVVRGLVVTDSDNQHLGKPFKQAFTDAHRAGNLSDGQTISFESIETYVETVKETNRGQLEIRARTTNFLTTPATVINKTTDARAGDLSTNARGGTPQQTIVLRNSGGGRSNKKLLTLSAGEMPYYLIKPLAQRLLSNPVQRTGSVALRGVRLQFGRGFVFELFNRDGESLGTYIVEGVSIALNNLGQSSQSTTQSLDVMQI